MKLVRTVSAGLDHTAPDNMDGNDTCSCDVPPSFSSRTCVVFCAEETSKALEKVFNRYASMNSANHNHCFVDLRSTKELDRFQFVAMCSDAGVKRQAFTCGDCDVVFDKSKAIALNSGAILRNHLSVYTLSLVL